MADIIKPAPLRLGDRYYYSLTSYDPVSIEITVPRVTEADVDMALLGLASEIQAQTAEEGAEPLKFADITNDWVAAHPETGAPNLYELREAIRKQLTQVNSQVAEESKQAKVAEALAARLAQSVPDEEVFRARMAMLQQFEADLAMEGVTHDQFLSQAGASEATLDAMFTTNARAIAEQDAALSAYVSEKKIKVEEAELPNFLGMPFDEAQQLIDSAKSAGQLSQLLHSAAQSKALRILVAEASCAYRQETPEEAEARTEPYKELLGGEQPKRRPEFKLV